MGDTSPTTGPMRFGVFEFDVRAGELRKNGSRIKLQDQPFQILRLLLERPGKIVTREEIQQKLWPDGTFVDFEHSLNAAVKRLRDALQDSADNPRFIETLPRQGYKFIYPIERAPRRWVWVSAGGLAVLLVLAVGLNLGGLRDRLFGGVAPGEITSIAVLPLDNLMNDPDQDYFVEGMHESLITELSKLGALKVISRTSTLRYKNTEKSIPEIAEELNVDAVIEGSVFRAGDTVRITAQLIDGRTDRNLWADNFDRDLTNILSLHSDVARAIAGEIKATVTPEEETRLAEFRPVNPQAYEAYLKGMQSSISWRESVEYFEQAIAIDPTYAPAYAQLANSYAHLVSIEPLTREEVATTIAKARAKLAKAVRLDDSSSEVLTIVGWFAFWELDWASAESAFRRALELDPSNLSAHHGYEFYFMAMGRYEEAIAEIRRARELDPLSAGWYVAAHAPFYRAGRYDEAIATLQKAFEMNPNMGGGVYIQLGKNYMGKGMTEEGLAAFQKAIDQSGKRSPWFLSYLVWGYAASGRRTEALKVLEEMKTIAKRRYVSPVFIGLAYTKLGETDLALQSLHRAYEERTLDVGVLTLLAAPMFDDLRPDPRFQSLLRRMNFPEN